MTMQRTLWRMHWHSLRALWPTLCLVLWAAAPVQAATITQDTYDAAGGYVGGGNPLQALTVVGEPAGGVAANAAILLHVGYRPTMPPLPPGTKTITVTGTVVDEAETTVTVNGSIARVSGGTFAAEITLIEGPNAITAIATDPAGNHARHTITVVLDTHPPARPTVESTPAVTTATSYTVQGTKTPWPSVWVNGTEVTPLNDATTGSATVPLIEGDNILVILVKDRAGNASA